MSTAATRILLAGDGRPFRDDVLRETARIAADRGAEVCVLQLMTIWGTGLGLPHPGLMPNRREKEAALGTVRDAVAALERRRVPLGHHRITATRTPAKAILRESRRIGAELIVMGQRAPRGRLHGLLWRDDARQVARRAAIEVRLITPPVTDEAPGGRAERSGRRRQARGAVDGGS